MLEVWQTIMEKNRNDVLFQSLYGPFMEAIQQMEMEDEDIEEH